MNLHDLKHRHAERNAFLRAANAGCADADRPHVRNLVEVARRATSVSVGALAPHLVQTPAFTVPLIAKLFYETAGIKVRATRALLMNVAVIGELGTALMVEFREGAGSGKLQDYPKQRVGIRRTAW